MEASFLSHAGSKSCLVLESPLTLLVTSTWKSNRRSSGARLKKKKERKKLPRTEFSHLVNITLQDIINITVTKATRPQQRPIVSLV